MNMYISYLSDQMFHRKWPTVQTKQNNTIKTHVLFFVPLFKYATHFYIMRNYTVSWCNSKTEKNRRLFSARLSRIRISAKLVKLQRAFYLTRELTAKLHAHLPRNRWRFSGKTQLIVLGTNTTMRSSKISHGSASREHWNFESRCWHFARTYV